MPAFAFLRAGMSKVTCPTMHPRAVLAAPHRYLDLPMHSTLKITIASIVLAVATPTAVNAQSSSGNISGEAIVGDTVTITGVDTGFKRELKIEKDGKYQIRRVPTGEYQVVRAHKDGTVEPAQSVVVRPGGTARVMESGKSEARDVFSGS